MIKQLLSIGALAAASTLTTQAALLWTGAEDGVSLYQESNWLDDNGAVPGANEINGGTAVTAATGGLIQLTSGTGTPAAFGSNFLIGPGNDIEIGGGKNLGSTGISGIQVASAQGTNVLGNLSGASTLNVQFTVDIDWSIDGASAIVLRGGGNPINGASTINFLDSASTLTFTSETVAAFTAEHLGKIKVNGAAAVIGTNINVVSDGGSGSIVTAIPEPSSAALLGLGGLALILRRRK